MGAYRVTFFIEGKGRMSGYKQCSQCDTQLPLEAFYYVSKLKGTRRSSCKECQAKASRLYYQDNRSSYQKRNSIWYENNKQRHSFLVKKKREENRVRDSEKKKQYYIENKDYIRAKNRNYNALKRGYPGCNCCTKDELLDKYKGCPDGYHVDHITTLSNAGKHCVKNLQYLSPKEHALKSNKERLILKRGKDG